MRNYDNALHSLAYIDSNYPRPLVFDILERLENRELLEYVYQDPFGAHIFPGDIADYPVSNFLNDLDQELATAPQIHLWAYIPTCRYRCHFCQFPIVLVNPNDPKSRDTFAKVIDLNIAEAKLWLEAAPHLGTVPIGEFNLFGGTPSLLPVDELERLVDFYRNNFNFSEATLRLEGEPGSLTLPFLTAAFRIGFRKISFGAQSFNDEVIRASGRPHTSQECFYVIANAKAAGFEWISVDLIYGLLHQTVESIEQDIIKARELKIDHLVCTKLHLKEYLKTRTGVSMQRPSVWQKKSHTEGENTAAIHLPTLGEQYQMRERIDGLLLDDYHEQPNMYYYKIDNSPEKWKGIITDQDKQFPEVAIGMGGSSKCRAAEAVNHTEYAAYQQSVLNGELPIVSAKGISPTRQQINSIKMALSSCQPVDDEIHKSKFSGQSFFKNKNLRDRLVSLQKRELIYIDSNIVHLSRNGRVLVEAIMNTELF